MEFNEAIQETKELYGWLSKISLGAVLVVLILVLVYIVSLWKLFKKAGKNGWEAIIPIYNIYVLIQISGLHWWYFILAILPTICIILGWYKLLVLSCLVPMIVNFFIYYNIAKRMKKSPVLFGILGVFFKFIAVLCLGFSKETIDNRIKVSANGPIEA